MNRIQPAHASTGASSSAPAESSTLRQRHPGAPPATPEGLTARTPAQQANLQAEPPRHRGQATLQTLRQAAQTVADAGAQAAGAGMRVGAAVGQAALNNPGMTAGMAAMVSGGMQLYVATNRNDLPSAVTGTRTVVVASVVVAAQALRKLLGRNPASLSLSHETKVDALNMLTGHADDIDLRDVTGRNTMNVINHLQDIATLPADQLRPQVHDAARRAQGNPETLVRNLLALVEAPNPVLSSRRGSAPQPRPQP